MFSKISVIMPVYNTEKFVWKSIESVLNQSFQDFEFIILDDFSSDWSFEICKNFAEKDKRIKLIRNEKNMWISFCRNKLIELSKTNYIVSQDSDDISEKNRLELSFNFLEKNHDFWVVSWNNLIINEEWKNIWVRKYSDKIRKNILKKSPISQPSSMFRKNLFEKIGWYNKNLDLAEDYDLWLRFYFNWFKIKNLDKNLIKYRLRKWQEKSEKIKETLENTILVQEKNIKKFWIKLKFLEKIFILIEKILLFFPKNFIFWLFKFFEYKK